jgi:hypothetical protein
MTTKLKKENRKLDTAIITESLEVQLTEKEIRTASKAMAEALRGKGQAEDEIKTFRSQKMAEVTRLEGQIAINAQLVNTEKEFRPVECEVSYDFAKGVKTTVRMDTGEVVRQEPVTNSDRQMFLDERATAAAVSEQ